METKNKITAKHRKDYKPTPYGIETTDLQFEIHEGHTIVSSAIQFYRRPDVAEGTPLVLDGDKSSLKLISIMIDGTIPDAKDFTIDDNSLTLLKVSKSFVVEIITEIQPHKNTALEGLYLSDGIYCSQCEAEGFRRITYYLDRPDVLSRFTTSIVSDKKHCPVMLSNGNLVDYGEIEGGLHFATWEDPFKKPCYLFALVAGDLVSLQDSFTTMSDRQVDLELFVKKQNLSKTKHAMSCLKQAMKWDEETFVLEYDLDTYMIVAVNDFNMGAMENKGLNVFNSKYVLADQATATDTDFANIQTVIGHEYFHNWTGNRVTCRDWFQLCLKEGLTVFRDQEFSADLNARSVKRIHDVKVLRTAQFPEDAGPMAHSIRPDSYIEMNNFYTATVYNKGAEIIRMIQTIVGVDGFKAGMETYITRHDGTAATCEDFIKSMEDANNADLVQFRNWYNQAGTPELKITDQYDAEAKTYMLSIAQSCPKTPGQDKKHPFHIPVKIGLIASDGHDMATKLDDDKTPKTNHTLQIISSEDTFIFHNVSEKPVPSILRDFSAPVKYDYPYTQDQLLFLAANDSNEFNRWDAMQRVMSAIIIKLAHDVKDKNELILPKELTTSIKATLSNNGLNKALIAEAISLPTEKTLAELMPQVLVDELHTAREFVKTTLAQQLQDYFLAVYHANHETDGFKLDQASIAKRMLKNTCLRYLAKLEQKEITQLIEQQYNTANNMTDQLAALACLASCKDNAIRKATLQHFYEQWKTDQLVMDKWLLIQAMSQHDDTIVNVEQLLSHDAFDITNPNKVYSLIGGFCHNNMAFFHKKNGAGYKLLAKQIKKIDKLNPQVASRMVRALINWQHYDKDRQDLMRASLQDILKSKDLSSDVYEIVSKSV